MKTVTALAVVLLLSGCGQWERTKSIYTGWSSVCVDGVSYLQFPSGVTVQYNRDGKIKNCN